MLYPAKEPVPLGTGEPDSGLHLLRAPASYYYYNLQRNECWLGRFWLGYDDDDEGDDDDDYFGRDIPGSFWAESSTSSKAVWPWRWLTEITRTINKVELTRNLDKMDWTVPNF